MRQGDLVFVRVAVEQVRDEALHTSQIRQKLPGEAWPLVRLHVAPERPVLLRDECFDFGEISGFDHGLR